MELTSGVWPLLPDGILSMLRYAEMPTLEGPNAGGLPSLEGPNAGGKVKMLEVYIACYNFL